MKKVSNTKQKLTLGKITVAKLMMNERQMRLINGGEDATKPEKPQNSRADGVDGSCANNPTRTQA
jgi:hypothetical protein